MQHISESLHCEKPEQIVSLVGDFQKKVKPIRNLLMAHFFLSPLYQLIICYVWYKKTLHGTLEQQKDCSYYKVMYCDLSKENVVKLKPKDTVNKLSNFFI